ncbi:MAG: IclR family transcriptional regulator [Desulfuromonadales bacterium]|nr:IclR family transcriptional regulator [Desulfuromonadales bacterium]
MPTRGKDSYSIQSVENALAVLEALCEEEEEFRISQLSEKLGMNKTSVFRLLATFENRGYVEREKGSGKYRLGLSAYEMGQKFLSRMGLLRKGKPVLERLVRECNEAVYLAVRRQEEALFLDLTDTGQQVKIVSLLGNRYPMAENAAGKVLLAHFIPEEAPARGKKSAVPGLTPSLQEELALIREQGYCLDLSSLGEGVASLAVPLFAASGEVPGALCMIGPTFRMTPERIHGEFLPRLKEAGEIISSKLGYMGSYLGKGHS